MMRVISGLKYTFQDSGDPRVLKTSLEAFADPVAAWGLC